MRRKVGLGAAWLLATLASVLIAAQAVGSVRDQVTDRPSPVVTAASALTGTSSTSVAGPASASGTVPQITSTTTDVPATTDGTITSTTEPAASTSTTVTSTAAPTTSTTTPPATATTTVPPRSTTTTSTTSTTTTTMPQELTTAFYDLVGGWVRISYAEGTVLLDAAGPKPGFVVKVENTGPQKVEVEFKSATHESKFTAKWEDGELDVKTDEKEGDGD